MSETYWTLERIVNIGSALAMLAINAWFLCVMLTLSRYFGKRR